MDFYFRQMWKDPRLSFNASHGIKTLSVQPVSIPCLSVMLNKPFCLQVGAEFLKNIWVPDTFFGENQKHIRGRNSWEGC